MPFFDFDFGGAATILEIPGLSGLLKDAIEDQINLRLVLPNKLVITLSDKVSAEELKLPKPKGALLIKVVEARDLIKADKLSRSDAYCIFKHVSIILK